MYGGASLTSFWEQEDSWNDKTATKSENEVLENFCKAKNDFQNNLEAVECINVFIFFGFLMLLFKIFFRG